MSYLVGEFFLQLLLPYIGSLYSFWTWRTGWAAFLTRLADGLYDFTFNACTRVTSTSLDISWHAYTYIRRFYNVETNRGSLQYPVNLVLPSLPSLSFSICSFTFRAALARRSVQF